MMNHYILPVLGVVCAAVLVLVIVRLHRRRAAMDSADGLVMDGHDFEYYCADILRSAGFIEVQVTRSSGDYGVDILAMKDGVSYAIQCKCYDALVGVEAVEEVYAGAAFYDRMVGVVMTNQYFTQPAVTMAAKLNVLLWDRGYISAMLDEEES